MSYLIPLRKCRHHQKSAGYANAAAPHTTPPPTMPTQQEGALPVRRSRMLRLGSTSTTTVTSRRILTTDISAPPPTESCEPLVAYRLEPHQPDEEPPAAAIERSPPASNNDRSITELNDADLAPVLGGSLAETSDTEETTLPDWVLEKQQEGTQCLNNSQNITAPPPTMPAEQEEALPVRRSRMLRFGPTPIMTVTPHGIPTTDLAAPSPTESCEPSTAYRPQLQQPDEESPATATGTPPPASRTEHIGPNTEWNQTLEAATICYMPPEITDLRDPEEDSTGLGNPPSHQVTRTTMMSLPQNPMTPTPPLVCGN
jgi:hypothetical protein